MLGDNEYKMKDGMISMLNTIRENSQLNRYYFNFYWGFYFFSASYFAWKNNREQYFFLRNKISQQWIPV
ncbi:hypothetical protein Amet_0645 [Alkaliphilus metalliredigens QYMF]|uniref:Uncharacterized protein n=1 Tax=Alkaliphilus metalliredigens (strain QYMF) TaxID=293826 RepID=A6TL02_ALKMQ|nr:hypothetical protein Amet_0645 [Alkaliphilus metalliredigens QYMF]